MTCELCGREGVQLTRHHLIPRATHRKPRTAKTFDRSEMKGRIAMLCRPCHKLLHVTMSEKQLAAEYNTIERLRAHPEIFKFVQWVATKPPGLRVPVRKRRP